MLKTFSLSGFDLMLELPLGVFKPTTTTQLLARHMGDLRGKVVLDLGCGAGPIAIVAAKRGAEKVYAVDIMTEACEVTRRNAEQNGVSDRIVVLKGNLFEPVHGLKFDVIIDDVSGMSEEVARLSPWYPKPIPTGGRDGTDPTIVMLKKSPEYIRDNGYLIFPIISLSNSEKTFAVAKEIFTNNLSLIVNKSIPFCPELKDHLELVERLKNEGVINFSRKHSRYLWNLAIYRASV